MALTLDDRINAFHVVATERPRYVYEYYVTGRGEFPFDMLRYDHCWPVDSVDAHKLAGDWASPLRSIKVRSYAKPTAPRWSSFVWSVGLEDLTKGQTPVDPQAEALRAIVVLSALENAPTNLSHAEDIIDEINTAARHALGA